MRKISITAVVVAFVAEFGLDQILSAILLTLFGHTAFSAEMSDAEQKAFFTAVWNDHAFVLVDMARGTATTILGGYFCARLAKVFPYYNGLAIGLLGFAFTLLMLFTHEAPWWYGAFGLLMAVPASIFGAHLAKTHIAAAP